MLQRRDYLLKEIQRKQIEIAFTKEVKASIRNKLLTEKSQSPSYIDPVTGFRVQWIWLRKPNQGWNKSLISTVPYTPLEAEIATTEWQIQSKKYLAAFQEELSQLDSHFTKVFEEISTLKSQVGDLQGTSNNLRESSEKATQLDIGTKNATFLEITSRSAE